MSGDGPETGNRVIRIRPWRFPATTGPSAMGTGGRIKSNTTLTVLCHLVCCLFLPPPPCNLPPRTSPRRRRTLIDLRYRASSSSSSAPGTSLSSRYEKNVIARALINKLFHPKSFNAHRSIQLPTPEETIKHHPLNHHHDNQEQQGIKSTSPHRPFPGANLCPI